MNPSEGMLEQIRESIDALTRKVDDHIEADRDALKAIVDELRRLEPLGNLHRDFIGATRVFHVVTKLVAAIFIGWLLMHGYLSEVIAFLK